MSRGQAFDGSEILACVADADVLEIEVEAGPEADSDEAVEWAEAA